MDPRNTVDLMGARKHMSNNTRSEYDANRALAQSRYTGYTRSTSRAVITTSLGWRMLMVCVWAISIIAVTGTIAILMGY